MAYSHHTKGIDIITDILKCEENVQAVISGGSIAHKTELESSDIDLMIVLGENDYTQAADQGKTWYCNTVEAEGKEIFVDGKYISLSFIKDVAERGSEPARYAFHGAKVAWSAIEGLERLVKEAAEYPKNKKNENIDRFWAQLKAWEWYFNESLKRNDEYLLRHSVNKTVLFAGRLMLAHNEKLFPYHKWFMTEIEKAADKPEGFMEIMNVAVKEPGAENIGSLVKTTQDFLEKHYTLREDWPNIFMRDSELGWKTGNLAVDDL